MGTKIFVGGAMGPVARRTKPTVIVVTYDDFCDAVKQRGIRMPEADRPLAFAKFCERFDVAALRVYGEIQNAVISEYVETSEYGDGPLQNWLAETEYS